MNRHRRASSFASIADTNSSECNDEQFSVVKVEGQDSPGLSFNPTSRTTSMDCSLAIHNVAKFIFTVEEADPELEVFPRKLLKHIQTHCSTYRVSCPRFFHSLWTPWSHESLWEVEGEPVDFFLEHSGESLLVARYSCEGRQVIVAQQRPNTNERLFNHGEPVILIPTDTRNASERSIWHVWDHRQPPSSPHRSTQLVYRLVRDRSQSPVLRQQLGRYTPLVRPDVLSIDEDTDLDFADQSQIRLDQQNARNNDDDPPLGSIDEHSMGPDEHHTSSSVSPLTPVDSVIEEHATEQTSQAFISLKYTSERNPSPSSDSEPDLNNEDVATVVETGHGENLMRQDQPPEPGQYEVPPLRFLEGDSCLAEMPLILQSHLRKSCRMNKTQHPTCCRTIWKKNSGLTVNHSRGRYLPFTLPNSEETLLAARFQCGQSQQIIIVQQRPDSTYVPTFNDGLPAIVVKDQSQHQGRRYKWFAWNPSWKGLQTNRNLGGPYVEKSVASSAQPRLNGRFTFAKHTKRSKTEESHSTKSTATVVHTEPDVFELSDHSEYEPAKKKTRTLVRQRAPKASSTQEVVTTKRNDTSSAIVVTSTPVADFVFVFKKSPTDLNPTVVPARKVKSAHVLFLMALLHEVITRETPVLQVTYKDVCVLFSRTQEDKFQGWLQDMRTRDEDVVSQQNNANEFVVEEVLFDDD